MYKTRFLWQKTDCSDLSLIICVKVTFLDMQKDTVLKSRQRFQLIRTVLSPLPIDTDHSAKKKESIFVWKHDAPNAIEK